MSSKVDMASPAASYHPRRPQDSDYYHCVEDYFETFVQSYDEHFTKQYGFWQPYIKKVICRYLDCGDLQNGFDYYYLDTQDVNSLYCHYKHVISCLRHLKYPVPPGKSFDNQQEEMKS
jgi:hypothetical protein